MFLRGAVLACGDALDDVGVAEQVAALGLAVEAIDVRLVAGEVFGEHFDGDVPAVGLVVAEVDEPHAPFAERAQNAELAEAAQRLQRVGRRARRRQGGVKVRRVHRVESVSAEPRGGE